MNNFIESVKAQMPAGAELGSGRFVVMGTPSGEVSFVVPENDPETVVARAEVGSLEGVADPEAFLRDMMAANRFWTGTNGAVLSLGDGDKVYLTARYEDDLFVDEEALGNVIGALAGTLKDWREHLAFIGGRLPGSESGKEVL